MPVDRNTVTRRVIEAIARAKKLPTAEIAPRSTFEELGVDSLDSIEILFQLEEEFDLEIPDEVAQGVDSVGEVIEALWRHLAAADS